MVRSGLRPIPVESPAMTGMFHRPWRSGTICRIRSRARRTRAKCRYSFHFAYTEGVDRDRKRSPSSLSHGSVLKDMPR